MKESDKEFLTLLISQFTANDINNIVYSKEIEEIKELLK